jgi:plastocyanin
MRRLTIVTAVLLAGTLAAFGADDKSSKKPKGTPVEIKGMKFDPKDVKVKIGETVVWTNKDDRDHTVVADDGKAFKSGNIKRGATFEQKFTKAGTYKYSCSYHPRMTGTVVVESE